MQLNVKAGPSNWQASWCRMLAIFVLLPAALLAAWVLGQHQRCTGTALSMLTPALLASGGKQQARQPPTYQPSVFEQEWMAAASKEMVERPGAVCDWVAAHGKQVQGWMAGVAAWQGGASASGNRSSRQGLPVDIFSRYQFPGSGITAPIEPLVGHLR